MAQTHGRFGTHQGGTIRTRVIPKSTTNISPGPLHVQPPWPRGFLHFSIHQPYPRRRCIREFLPASHDTTTRPRHAKIPAPTSSSWFLPTHFTRFLRMGCSSRSSTLQHSSDVHAFHHRRRRLNPRSPAFPIYVTRSSDDQYTPAIVPTTRRYGYYTYALLYPLYFFFLFQFQ